jgi:hypothetical protein
LGEEGDAIGEVGEYLGDEGDSCVGARADISKASETRRKITYKLLMERQIEE